MGDIGDHFPPSDPQWKDYPGGGFLEAVAGMLERAGWRIGNVDCVVMSDAVRLGNHKLEMAAAMAKHLGIDSAQVNVGATTAEGHGAVGRGEIIACHAVVTITSD
jgi:2-C-methyl-D-erythritol 2,4-cyclodiphosphate synthase